MAWLPSSFIKFPFVPHLQIQSGTKIFKGKILYYIIIAYYNIENVLIIFKNPVCHECLALFDFIVII